MTTASTQPLASPSNRQALVRGLLGVLPPESVLHEPEDLHPYECDGLSAYRQLPLVVALPGSVEQVQAIMVLCHRLQIPVVPRGAGTGLSGGALPIEDGVVLSLAKLKSILSIDPVARTARVQPGVATSPCPRRRGRTASTTPRTPPPRSPAASAATWRRTPAACTA